MKENLNVGSKIVSTATPNQTNNGVIEKYCYNDLDANCTDFGGLYQWAEMVKYFRGSTNDNSMTPALGTSNLQGICPPGWHIPSSTEWATMIKIYDGAFNGTSVNVSNTAGAKFKETGTTHWNSPNTSADNASSFSAFGGGIYSGSYTVFKYLGHYACVDDVNYSSKYVYFKNDNTQVVIYSEVKANALSVRCLKGAGIDMGLGIENNKLDIGEIMDVFPNPASQNLNFNFKKSEPQDAHVFIVNSVGETVFSTLLLKDNFSINNSIRVENLPKGNYFFKVEINNKVYSKKIIIERK